jgi:serine/threonine-protein kinase
VGVSLYELVTGKHAFDGDSQFSIMSAHLEKTPTPPIVIDPKLPPALNDLILLSVTRDPDRRFQTAEAFRNALKSVMEATAPVAPPVARPVSRVAPAAPAPAAAVAAGAATPPPQKSNRALWATVGALCFVGVLVGAIEFGPWKKAEADSPPPKAAAAPQQQLVVVPAAPSNPPAEQPAPIAQPGAVQQPAPTILPQVRPLVPTAGTVRPPAATTGKPAISAAPAAVSAPDNQGSAPAAAATQPAPQSAVPAPSQPPAAQRAELQKARESMVLLSARASGIHSTLQNLQRSQAATGLGMRTDWVQAASLMDTYLQGTSDALAAGDAAAARDFLEKGERQIERLEKALNK